MKTTALLKQKAVGLAQRNPTRYSLVERLQELIDAYNAGSLNIEEYLRRLIDLSRSLTDEEQRAVREDLSEEELAIVDLLTKPEPVLTDAQLAEVKAGAKKLLAHLHEKLVLDWRRKADAAADVLVTIRRSLDEALPADPYPVDVFDDKVQRVYDHVLAAYHDDGSSVYATDGGGVPHATSVGAPVADVGPIDINAVTDALITRLRIDPDFAARVAAELDERHNS